MLSSARSPAVTARWWRAARSPCAPPRPSLVRHGRRAALARFLQRGRAAHHGVRLIHGHVDERLPGCAVDGVRGPGHGMGALVARRLHPGAGLAYLAQHVLGGLIVEALEAEEVPEHTQHLPARARLADGRRRPGMALPQPLAVNVRA